MAVQHRADEILKQIQRVLEAEAQGVAIESLPDPDEATARAATPSDQIDVAALLARAAGYQEIEHYTAGHGRGLLRRLVGWLLRPVAVPQAAFNREALAVIEILARRVNELTARLDELERQGGSNDGAATTDRK
jgi:hypothetical protein